jgi:hypothetical protein
MVDALNAVCRDLRARVAVLEAESITVRPDSGYVNPVRQGNVARLVEIKDVEEEAVNQVCLANLKRPTPEGVYLYASSPKVLYSDIRRVLGFRGINTYTRRELLETIGPSFRVPEFVLDDVVE